MSSGQEWNSVSQSTAIPQNELQERLAEVAGRAKNFTGAGGVAIALAAGEQFATFVGTGNSLAPGAIIPIPASFGGFRKEKGNVLRCPDTDKEATIDLQACRAARIKSMLVVPIGELSSVRGVLTVFSSAAHAFTETHVAVLKTLAEVISHLLPEKERLGQLQPEKKTDELLEHPFNPAFDNFPKPVKVGASELPDVSQAPSPPPAPAPARASKETGSIFAGGAMPPSAAWKPAPAKSLSVPPLPKPSTLLTPNPAASTAPSKPGSLLDLASDPIAEGALVAPKPKQKPKRSKGVFTRSVATTSIGAIPTPQRRGFEFDLRKFYTALIAVVALVAATWGLMEYVAVRNARRVAESYVIPPSPERSSRARPAPVAPVTPAPSPVSVSEAPAAPIKTDVVRSATAAILPDRTPASPPAPSPKPERVAVPKASAASDTMVLKGQDIVVVSQPSPAAIRQLEEESAPPPMSVPGNSGMISDVLNTPASAPAPVLKRSQIVAAVVVSKVAPVYPDQAKRYGLAGQVVISAKVTKSGTVGDVRSISGNAILSEAAATAVRKWRYKPATLDGRPVDSTVEVTFSFTTPR